VFAQGVLESRKGHDRGGYEVQLYEVLASVEYMSRCAVTYFLYASRICCCVAVGGICRAASREVVSILSQDRRLKTYNNLCLAPY
jgi:hypothetical protein